jgi:hypothetical protein
VNHTAPSPAPAIFFDYTAIDCDPDLSRPLHRHRRTARPLDASRNHVLQEPVQTSAPARSTDPPLEENP